MVWDGPLYQPGGGGESRPWLAFPKTPSEVPVRWLGFVAGLLIVLLTGASIVVTLVLPRGRSRVGHFAGGVVQAVHVAFLAVARLARSYPRQDAVLAPVGPVALLVQLTVWLALLLAGYSLMLWPFAGRLGDAVHQAGSAMFTLGLVEAPRGSSPVLGVAAAATGMVAIALQIAYLPSIYGSFNRRETLVTLLESRAGVPAWGPEVLLRHHVVGIVDALPAFYASWEQWAAEVSESHANYPVLVVFRSPETWSSWILSLLAVLDAAAMHLALSPTKAPSEARLCLRMGFTALRRIGGSLGWRYERDPRPDDPLELQFDDFSGAVTMLADAGFPMERSAEEAWPHFRGWRVNYEALAYRLADHVVAPPAPWSGHRRHVRGQLVTPERPPHRSPDGTLVVEGVPFDGGRQGRRFVRQQPEADDVQPPDGGSGGLSRRGSTP